MKTGIVLNLEEFATGAPLRADKDGEPSSIDLELAVFLLLGEASAADETLCVSELREIVDVMSEQFGHSEAEVMKLSAAAEQISSQKERLQELLQLLRGRFTIEQRTWAFSLAWRVILADGVIKESERKIAEHLASELGLNEKESNHAIELAKARTLPEGFTVQEEK